MVSSYGLATTTFGTLTPEADALRQLDMARDCGLTLIAIADEAAPGQPRSWQGSRVQDVVGEWFATRQSRAGMVIANAIDVHLTACAPITWICCNCVG